jgi:hypothetical protein
MNSWPRLNVETVAINPHLENDRRTFNAIRERAIDLNGRRQV